jgi:hypothetical protein
LPNPPVLAACGVTKVMTLADRKRARVDEIRTGRILVKISRQRLAGARALPDPDNPCAYKATPSHPIHGIHGLTDGRSRTRTHHEHLWRADFAYA